MRRITGKCHCGNIAYELVWPDPGQIPVRACTCTFCRKHGGVYTSHPDARLEVRISDLGRVNKYAFATRTARFYVCRDCGAVPFVHSAIEGTDYAVVNVNTFEGVDPSELRRSAADFEGEKTADRLARRQRTWIPRVSIHSGKS
ncbi:MAG: GFA family protein [Alphaproteobacteria bacterium]